eukprot:m.18098 g.18098  ORF g.18098 m.18098 type:complete len:247 (+) comp7293_c0_seq1:1963-2703(+)
MRGFAFDVLMSSLLSVFLLLSATLASATTANRCSRLHSRQARAALQDSIQGFLDTHGEILTSPCPLRVENSMYHDHEVSFVEEGHKRFHCDLCGKKFTSAQFLDGHMERKHANLTNAAGSCLGDLCDILVCERFATDPRELHQYTQRISFATELEQLSAICSQQVMQCLVDPSAPYALEIVEATCGHLSVEYLSRSLSQRVGEFASWALCSLALAWYALRFALAASSRVTEWFSQSQQRQFAKKAS